MPLFEETPVTIAYPISIVTARNEHTRSRKCHLFRRKYFSSKISNHMVTSYIAHIRSRKCNFFRRLHLLQIITVVMVNRYTEHMRSKKCHFFGDCCYYSLPSCNGYYTLLTYQVQKMPCFEETPVTITYLTFIVTTCTEHTRSRKWPF